MLNDYVHFKKSQGRRGQDYTLQCESGSCTFFLAKAKELWIKQIFNKVRKRATRVKTTTLEVS